ncbi:MAG: LD-carboxypeptidase [Bacteroidales bacterium]|nr:LD-carboxypeptidase [Bacteroidales bacterium]
MDPHPSCLTCQLPPFLRDGDAVAMISPSYIVPPELVSGAAEVLRSWGYRPRIGEHVGRVHARRYAGTLEERLSDLRAALQDPQVKAILCNRGGYGALHLMERMQPEEFSAEPKWLIGFSDITMLLEMQNCAGVVGIHGPMDQQIASAGGEDPGSRLLRALLRGRIPCYELPAHPLNLPGRACGTLVGGNLCTFSPVLGQWADATRYDGIILFIEEVEETMHHIDRLMRMLRLGGVLDRCRGVVLGEFTGCGDEFGCGSVEAMLRPLLEPLGIPVLCGFPAGHGGQNVPLLMGAPVTLDVRQDGASLRFDVPGEQVETILSCLT